MYYCSINHCFWGPIQLVLTSHQFFSMFVHNNMAKTLCKHKKLGFSELDEKELLGKEKKEEGDERVTQLF